MLWGLSDGSKDWYGGVVRHATRASRAPHSHSTDPSLQGSAQHVCRKHSFARPALSAHASARTQVRASAGGNLLVEYDDGERGELG